jgi:hypothetical protein
MYYAYGPNIILVLAITLEFLDKYIQYTSYVTAILLIPLQPRPKTHYKD